MTFVANLLAGLLLLIAAAFLGAGTTFLDEGTREDGDRILGIAMIVTSFALLLAIIFCVLP